MAPLIRERAAVSGVSEADWIRGCIADRLGLTDLPEFKPGNPNFINTNPVPEIVDTPKAEVIDSPLDIFRF